MKYIIFLFGCLIKTSRIILVPILNFIYKKKVKQLPEITNDLLKISAIDLADKIRKGEVSSEEVIKTYIDRIREVNPIINAVSDDRFHGALQDARKADKLVKEKSEEELLKSYPLLGVPLSVKESVSLKGMSLAVGRLADKGEIAKKDGATVEILKKAGAIPICVTNTGEWCTSFESYNLVNGRTLNPYDLSRTSGGSSGGEAALISSAGSLIGIGSDLAGSIRDPAFFCGIFGHKPTGRVLNHEGHFPTCPDKRFQGYLCVGPMARYSKDLLPLLRIMSNNNPKLRLDEPVQIKDIKIFYSYHINASRFVQVPLDESIKESLSRGLEYFRNRGLKVQQSNINLKNIHNIGIMSLAECEDAPDLMGYRQKVRDNPYLELLKIPFGLSKYSFNSLGFSLMMETVPLIPQKTFEIFGQKRENLKKEFTEMLGTDGVFFFPTFGVPAFRHYESLTLFSVVAYSQIFNVLELPSTHVPLGLNEDGLPIGFQVVAGPYQDRLCLAVANELEKAFGGWVPPS